MNAFYHEIETNRDFVIKLYELIKTSYKLDLKPMISIYDENGDDMKLQLYAAAFTSRKRKGIKEGNTYLWLKATDTIHSAYELSRNEQISLMGLWEHILSNIPENATFSAPIIFNDRSGSYYRLIGIGFDRFFNAAFWCKKIH